MKCINCVWYVDENEKGEYKHELAKETKNGFCLMQDLFTCPNAEQERYCTNFEKEEEK